MRALQAHAGATEARLVDVEIPAVGPDEIRVRVAAAAVNPADLWAASGGMREAFGLPDTTGIGYDVAGNVEAVGADVEGFAVGDTVAASHGDPAAPVRSHAELVTLNASWAAHVPAGLGVTEAASVPVNALTAAQGLDLLGEPDGRRLLVTGAAGAVGGYAVALAARAGWEVTGLARPGDEDFVRGAGAKGFVTEVPGPEFDAVLDAAALQERAIGAVRDGGTIVGVLPPAPIAAERGIEVTAVQVAADGTRLAELLALSVDGTLEVRVAGEFPLADFATAYARQAAGGSRGRWLLVP